MAETASHASSVASHAQDKSASNAGQVSSSLGSHSTAFDYHNTQPLPGFNPPTPYQYFTQLNDILGSGKSPSRARSPPHHSSGGLSPVLPPSRRPRPHGKTLVQMSANASKAYERSLMSDSDKRQIVQNLSDYVRVFCGSHKGRFLVQDIDQLILEPVVVKPEKYDTSFAQRRQLLGCLLDYFKSGRVHPLHWFDVITSWKGGHKRVMTYQEFVVGFKRYCDELCYSSWEEEDLEKVFQFLLRSQQFPIVRRQDFRFAMRRNSLTKRRIAWINKQARMIRKLRKFITRMHAKFSDFCPPHIIRKRSKTINLHELESTLFLVLTDLVIFLNCRHADELLNKHSMKLSKSQHRRRRRHGMPVEFRKAGGGAPSLDEMSSGDELSTQDSLDDMSFISQDDGSVGSLLSQTSQSCHQESSSSSAAVTSIITSVPFSSATAAPTLPSSSSSAPSTIIVNATFVPARTSSAEFNFKSKKDLPANMHFTRKSFTKPLFMPDPNHPSNLRADASASSIAKNRAGSMSLQPGAQGRRTNSQHRMEASSDSDTSASPPNSAPVKRRSYAEAPSRGTMIPRTSSKQSLGYSSFSAPATDGTPVNGRDLVTALGALAADSSIGKEVMGSAQLRNHLTQHLQPHELEYLRSLVVQVNLQAAAGNGAVAADRARGAARGHGESSASFIERHSHNSPGISPTSKRHSIVKRHSIIQRYTVIRQSKLVSPSNSAQSAANTEGNAELDEDWDERYLGMGTRRPTAIEANISADLAQRDPHAEVMQDIDVEELAAFEKNMEERKIKLAKEFKCVTDHFDRRINLARSRLHQNV